MLILSNVIVVDPKSEWDGKNVTITMIEGIIDSIYEGACVHNGAGVIDATGLYISPGWVAVDVSLQEPNYTNQDNAYATAQAAIVSGFTDVILSPNMNPMIDNIQTLMSIKRTVDGLPIKFHFLGALSINNEGKEMAELGSLCQEGIAGFCAGTKHLPNLGFLSRALAYLLPFHKLSVVLPHDKDFAGTVNESPATAGLGLETVPSIAEELAIERGIKTAQYSGGKLLFSPITLASSAQKVKQYFPNNTHIYTATAPHYLFFSDECYQTFDTSYKVFPPFRSEVERLALIESIKNDEISMLCVQHMPCTLEEKEVEFEYASFGISTLLTFFPMAFAALGKVMPLNKIIALFTDAPRTIFDLPKRKIACGATADLTLFDIHQTWKLCPENLHSFSRNTPLLDQTLQGKVVATIVNGRYRTIPTI